MVVVVDLGLGEHDVMAREREREREQIVGRLLRLESWFVDMT